MFIVFCLMGNKLVKLFLVQIFSTLLLSNFYVFKLVIWKAERIFVSLFKVFHLISNNFDFFSYHLA